MTHDGCFIEVDYSQRQKHGQDICGDAFYCYKTPGDGRVIVVLSDGLGSGVKANILASMTTRMAAQFAASDLDFLHSATIMMDTLPVCQVRKISYATFTIIDCRPDGETRVIEMDNPACLFMRGEKPLPVASEEMQSPRYPDRRMRVSHVALEPGDRIVLPSDGVSQSGLSTREYPLGWREDGFRDFVLQRVEREPEISARRLADSVVREALRKEPRGRAQDDITCGVLYFRHPRRLLVLSGPPYSKDRDGEYARMIETFDGKKAICGGTTACIIARELKREVEMSLDAFSPDLPPPSRMNGVDLITEGILTLTKTAQAMEQDLPLPSNSPAMALVELLREGDVIEFVVGSRINEAHQDPSLPVEIEIRRNIIKRIAKVLEEKYLKEVSIRQI